MDINEYIALLKQIHVNFKINDEPINHSEVDGLSFNLKNKLHEAKTDKRWPAFKTCLAQQTEWDCIIDWTTFSYSMPCFKIMATLNKESRYIIELFFSVISGYYAFKIKEKSLPVIEVSEVIDKIMINPEINWKLRDLFSEQNFFMDLKEKQIKLEALLASSPDCCQLLNDRTETVYPLNEYPDHLKDCMAKVMDCQKRVFNYKLLDSRFAGNIVPGVATNLKVEGTATLFDCVFTDVHLS